MAGLTEEKTYLLKTIHVANDLFVDLGAVDAKWSDRGQVCEKVLRWGDVLCCEEEEDGKPSPLDEVEE